jgi:ketosteroid isomerase-like protein
MKKITILLALTFLASCKTYDVFDAVSKEKSAIDSTLTDWHKAAAEAKFDTYFSLMTNDGVFLGTDPTENWQNKAFRDFSKPYFDKGKAWNFTAIERNIYLDSDYGTAWFDELLDTQMKICRGSGVLKKVDGKWKIAHYVLSMTIPNDNIDKVIEMKESFDNNLVEKLKKK